MSPASSPPLPVVAALALVALFVALDVWVLADASRRRSRHVSADTARSVVGLVGTADLVLSTNARWLRHPSSVEPWAAVSDHPASLDVEPAGMVIGPPFPNGPEGLERPPAPRGE